jgi:hypothetical protein
MHPNMITCAAARVCVCVLVSQVAGTQLGLGLHVVVDCPLARVQLYEDGLSVARKVCWVRSTPAQTGNGSMRDESRLRCCTVMMCAAP